MSRITDKVYQRFFALGEALNELLAHAHKHLPADRFRVIEGTMSKMISTADRFGAQLGYLLEKYEQFSQPPKGPRGPAEVHRLSQYRQRRKKRPR